MLEDTPVILTLICSVLVDDLSILFLYLTVIVAEPLVLSVLKTYSDLPVFLFFLVYTFTTLVLLLLISTIGFPERHIQYSLSKYFVL